MRICSACQLSCKDDERFCPKCGSFSVEQADIDRVGTQVGNYFLKKVIGRGGMGTVFEGEHVYIKKTVAVKILHPRYTKFQEAVTRFIREARAASAVQHPNIVDVTDFGPLPDGGVFFVMEHLSGRSLEDELEQDGALPLHRAINVANQLALALATAHERGVIHRDLKPENIMLIPKPGRRDIIRNTIDGKTRYVVENEGNFDFVKILDFGIAKNLQPDELKGGQTMAGAVFGTPEYMSPEAARGKEVDHRADIYSLGIILFDMLCGGPPFEAEAAADVLAMHLKDIPPAASSRAKAGHEVTEAADALIAKALSKDPEDRHDSMDEFRAELQNCYGNVTFRRHGKSEAGINQKGPQHRDRNLTEEIDEWLHSGEPALTDDEARALANGSSADEPLAKAQ